MDDTVVKVSDVQHAKRALEGQLIKIRGNHKELTHTVTKYVKKYFSYAIAQNEGDANGLAKALRAIPGHMFGDHSSCGGQLCGYLKDPQNYKHKFTKGGKDLSSPALQSHLTAICQKYAGISHRLCLRGSSQRNESLNNTIGSKAPKIRHYGGVHQMITVWLLQYHKKHWLRLCVLQALNVSPGKFSKMHANRMNKIMDRNRQQSRLPSQKRQRLIRHSLRNSQQMELETREGTSYETGIAYTEDKLATTQIPEAVFHPTLQILRGGPDCDIIIIDVETSGTSM